MRLRRVGGVPRKGWGPKRSMGRRVRRPSGSKDAVGRRGVGPTGGRWEQHWGERTSRPTVQQRQMLGSGRTVASATEIVNHVR